MMASRYVLFLTLLVTWIASSQQACGPCARHASCNEATDKCECDSGYEGDGSFYCNGPNRKHCDIFGDPVVYGFSGGKTRLQLACRAHLAVFDIDEGSDPSTYGTETEGMVTKGSVDDSDCGIGKCRFIVKGDIELSNGGQYYVGQINVRMVVNIGRPKMYSVERILIQIDGEVARYQKNRVLLSFGTWVDLPRGQCTEETLAGVSLSICHNAETNVWLISNPGGKCGDTAIAYRPWNPDFENQPRTPGVVISNEGNLIGTEKFSQYPVSFCHVPPPVGNATVYKDYRRNNGLRTLYGSSIHAMIAVPDVQFNKACLNLDVHFLACPKDKKVGAINACQDIPLKWAMCAKANGHNSVDVFAKCIGGYCWGKQSKCDSAAKEVKNSHVPGCPTYSSGLFSC